PRARMRPRRPSGRGPPCPSRARINAMHPIVSVSTIAKSMTADSFPRPAPILAVAIGAGQGPATPNGGRAGPTMAGRGGGAEHRDLVSGRQRDGPHRTGHESSASLTMNTWLTGVG